MKLELDRDNLKNLAYGKYISMNDFSFDAANAKHFCEGFIFAIDLLAKQDKEIPYLEKLKMLEIEEVENAN